MKELWDSLSSQGKIYVVCQAIYFILIVIGLCMLGYITKLLGAK